MKLDKRTIRLIAVGASVSANCMPCLEHNASKARADGADKDEIAEAVEVGRRVRKGAASKMDAFTAGLNSTTVMQSAIDNACDCA